MDVSRNAAAAGPKPGADVFGTMPDRMAKEDDMSRTQIRQGDVLLVPRSEAPAATVRALDAAGQPLLGLRVEGERTGHAHELAARVYDAPGGHVLFLERPAPLTHPEHGTSVVPAGWWDVRIQREHVPLEAPRGRFD